MLKVVVEDGVRLFEISDEAGTVVMIPECAFQQFGLALGNDYIQMQEKLAKAESQRDAYREAGARMGYTSQRTTGLTPLSLQECLELIDEEAKLILSKRS